VPGGGVEPPRPEGRRILSRADRFGNYWFAMVSAVYADQYPAACAVKLGLIESEVTHFWHSTLVVGLQQNRLAVVVKKLFLALSECSHVDDVVCRHSHSVQG
jgi:hypothetical protein